MVGILRWLFPDNQGFDVVQEDGKGNTIADFDVFKICCRPGGSSYQYDFCLVESKKASEPWGSTEDHCRDHCFNTDNESKQVYAIVHIGLEIAFYRYNRGDFSRMSGRLHVRNDVQVIIQWANYMKSNPLPFV